MNSVCTQLYYLLEHAAWAADHQLLPLNSSSLWTGAIALWALPLLIACVQILGKLMRQIKTNANQQLNLVLDLVENLCNLGLAIFWMPKGFLWGGKLSSLWWGLLGTVSSLISLYKTIKSQQMPNNVCTHEEVVSTH